MWSNQFEARILAMLCLFVLQDKKNMLNLFFLFFPEVHELYLF